MESIQVFARPFVAGRTIREIFVTATFSDKTNITITDQSLSLRETSIAIDILRTYAEAELF